MFGFIGAVNCSIDFNELVSKSHPDFISRSFKENKFSCNDLKIVQKTINKFENDKVFCEDSFYFICIEGVIYNSINICEKYKSLEEALLSRLHQNGISSLSDLDGVFCAVVFDKMKNKIYLFSDHTAMKSLFYYVSGNKVIFSTDYVWLIDSIKKDSCFNLKLSRTGAYCLLSYGYMLDEYTLADNVYKVLPGQVIEIVDEKVNKTQYYDYTNIKQISAEYDELLDTANTKFTNAIRKIYSKDDEYGYKHVCTLSGGLDSRSILFTSYELGYTNQLTLTMSEDGTLDQKISQRIASDLNVENFFYLLNGGNYLKSIDYAIDENGGIVTYQGLLHSDRLFSLVNLSKYGAIHSGEIGDAIFGGHPLMEYKLKARAEDGAFSKLLINKVPKEATEKAVKRCGTTYMFFLLERGFNSTVNGWYSATPYTEYTSAFLDKDFITFILSVPDEYRANSNFYINWMKKYHPKMCQYKWERTNSLPDSGKLGRAIGRATRSFEVKILKKHYDMNPYELWLNNTPGLRNYLNEYYKTYRMCINNPDIRRDTDYLYKKGSDREKFQALTLVGSARRFGYT